MFAKTQNTVSMILGAALFAAAVFASPAIAGDTSLSQNEHASQGAIAGSADTLPASVDALSATLARNETLAQHAIVDASPRNASVDTIGQVTLTQNEIAAQRVIADAPVSSTRYAANAKTRVASTRSPNDR